MKPQPEQRPIPDVRQEREQWQKEYRAQIGEDRPIRNRSGVELRPLYTPLDWNPEHYLADVGFPGHEPFARGIYPTMHRGRTWSQRQLVGLGVPRDYNRRVLALQEAGTNAISLLPCNSVFRGYDCDEVPSALLGTCGTVINCVEHMEQCLEGVPFDRISTALNDPSPFTLLAFLLVAARRRDVAWSAIAGTSNQSDYLSHCVANHMFFRLALPAARRILTDHIAFCTTHLPKWNPISVVGQHMQQAGATPAEAMGLTLSSALQIASDCIERGLAPDQILPRFSFFFDISISFFEEIAKFRAGRRVWARVTKEQLGARDPRSWRFKFHGQTSGADLTLQQPLNNVARVTAQAIAGILSGLQSMHTDAWDEAIATPSEEAARIAIATQNILRHEAGLCDVIDPLGGSYYVETLTNQMESEILSVMDRVAAAGGMYRAVESGVVQRMVGQSALAHQRKLDSGEQKQVGVNCFKVQEACSEVAPERPDRASIEQCVRAFREYKASRSRSAVSSALAALAMAVNSNDQNVFAAVVAAVESGVTHGEVVACLRREAGFGMPMVVA